MDKILTILAGAVNIITGIGRFFFARQQQAIGEMKQKNADVTATDEALKREAQAAADAPVNTQEVLSDLDKGNF